MMLFLVKCEYGHDKHVFARNCDHAAEQFVEWQLATGAEKGDFSIGRVTLSSQSKLGAAYLRHALAQARAGIGNFHEDSGWSIDPTGYVHSGHDR